MDKIFISYSRRDIDFVRKLAGDLEKAGYGVWWDLAGLHGGDIWQRAISDAIQSSKYVIVVMSPDSAGSDWVEREYTHAISLRKKILPVMLRRSGVPFALNTINYVDFTSEDYVCNFNNLLTALGHTGERPTIIPPIIVRATSPAMLRKYAIPIGIGLLGVLLLLAILLPKGFSESDLTSTPPAETSTPASPTATPEVTSTVPADVSPTIGATVTSVVPLTPEVPTATPTASPLPPAPARVSSLPICIYDRNANGIFVRESPSNADGSNALGLPIKGDGTRCLFFSARHEHVENEWTKFWWFQVAPLKDQKGEFQAEEIKDHLGGWISGEVLAAFDLPTRGNLPLCIYSRSVGSVYVRDIPSEFNYNTIGDPLTANGTKCPFFNFYKENEGKFWFQLAPLEQQRGEFKDKGFKDYSGGWISEDYLAVFTLQLPVVTLTPIIPPTVENTASPTSAPTEVPTLIATDTPVPISTETLATETPTPQ